jgi:predicted ATPase/class 3 adenylate cyclase/tetratricopeptide (TPR) repeat protein
MPELKVKLLGTPEFSVDETPVNITRRKALALLAYLAVTGQPQRREHLATLLWPDFEAAAAYAYLRNTLWMIRQTPIADYLDLDHDILGLTTDPPVWVDVAAFDRDLTLCQSHAHPVGETCERCVPLLKRTVALYEGDFMTGFSLEDSAAFDEWQFFQAEELRQRLTGALRRLVVWHSRSTDLDTALDYAQRWLHLDPLNEEASRSLMKLYTQNDQRSAALRIYTMLTTTLKAQGLSPSDETVALYRRVRANDIPRSEGGREVFAALPAMAPHQANLPPHPTGTVTFLFTDIESSVALWDQHPAAMKQSIVLHHRIVRETIEAYSGAAYKVIGDAFQAAFALAPQALAAAVALQHTLIETDWAGGPPLRVRIGLHTGPAQPATEASSADYEVSHTLNRAARIMSAGHGGQILLSQETAALIQQELPPELTLRDLGQHHLKGLAREERIYQILAPGLRQDFPPLATAVRPIHNLPMQTTPFIGRGAELSELRHLLDDPTMRLITLTGTGGIGKTRLAIQVAEASVDAFPDGITFVPLATVMTAEGALAALTDALSLVLYQQATASPLTQLATYLSDRQILLILDNFEQVKGGAALVTELLAHTHAPKLLVTSRRRLNLRSEWTLELQGLPWPDSDDAKPTIPGSAAALFLTRAQQVQGGFDPTSEDLRAVARICRLVQGLPLGLELAAAWTRLLSCGEIAEEISQNLDFLALTQEDRAERHRSLRAVFTQSWALLSPAERDCLGALSVFRGGFTRQAATEVTGTSLPLLASLIDHSMLRRTPSGRYEILEVLRQHAEEQLTAVPARHEAARDRHCANYLDLLARLEPALKGPGQAAAFGQLAALEAIEEDMANIRAAWRWALTRGFVSQLRAATISLALYCDIRSRFRDGLELFGEAIAALGGSGTAGEAPTDVSPAFLGLLWGLQGEWRQRLSLPGAIEALQQGLTLVTEHRSSREHALVNVLSAYGQTWLGPERAAQQLEESLAIFRAQQDSWGTALALSVIGEGSDLAHRRDTAAARAHTEQALALRQQAGDIWGSGMSLFTLGAIALWENALYEAQRYFRESLVARQSLKDTYGIAHCMRMLGWTAYRIGELEEAQQLVQQALTMIDEIGTSQGAIESLLILADIERDRGRLQHALAYLISARDRHRAFKEPNATLAHTLLQLGDISHDLGESQAARRYYEESVAVSQQVGDEVGSQEARAKLATL